jgi:AmiR/NasT family two-component response regulator
MCRALRVLCAAAHADRLSELKRASVGAQWELVGGSASLDDLHRQVAEFEPDVVIIDAALGPLAVERTRAARRTVRIVAVGFLPGADAQTDLGGVRAAILGLPPPGGPVRT